MRDYLGTLTVWIHNGTWLWFLARNFFRVITEKPASEDHTQENVLLCFNTFLNDDYRIKESIQTTYSNDLKQQLRPQHIFSLWEESGKEALEIKYVIKICPNRGRIFQNKLRNIKTAIPKTVVCGWTDVYYVKSGIKTKWKQMRRKRYHRDKQKGL